MKYNVTTLEGKDAGSMTLSADIFGLETRKDLLQRVVNWQLAAARQGSANTKIRGEIARTSKKHGPQKGSGNARHGSRRSNIFVGGATQFGPRPRDWSQSLNKKVRTLALKNALSTKAGTKDLIILEDTALKSHKTKDLVQKLEKLGATNATFIVAAHEHNFDRASRNIPHIKVLPTEGANVYDILHQEKLVMTKEAIALLEGRLSAQSSGEKLEKTEAKAETKPAAKKAAAKPAAKKAPAKKPAAKKEAK